MGGQQRRLASLVAGLGADFTHKIVSLDGDLGAMTLVDGAATAEAIEFRKSATIDFGNIARLGRAIRAAAPDVLCTYNWGSLEAALANRLGPRARHVHHEDGFGPDELNGEQLPRRILARRLILRGSYVTIPSAGLERIARDIWRLDPQRIVRNPVGVDLARFREPARTYRRTPVKVVAIGALRREKNFARLIGCFEKADPAGNSQLTIFGDGPQIEALRGRAAQSPASDRISLPGPTHAPHAALSGADIFALSSDTEQTPISLIEAMASGLPLVATDVGDIASMVSVENRPFVVAVADEGLYAAALRRLISDAGLRETVGRANLWRSTSFDERAMVDAFRTLYARAAGRTM